MSLSLYQRLLKWEGLKHFGWIKVGGHTAELREHPPILLQLLDIWYCPDVQQRECRENSVNPRRDLRPEEIAELERYIGMLDGEWSAAMMRADRRT